MKKIIGGIVGLALLLAGCGTSGEDGPLPAAPTAAASNYSIPCRTTTGVAVTITDYHQGWAQDIAKCEGDDTEAIDPQDYMTGPLTEVQTKVASEAGLGGPESYARFIGNQLAQCSQDQPGDFYSPEAYEDVVAGRVKYVTAPDMQREFRAMLQICPDHPWAADWQKAISS